MSLPRVLLVAGPRRPAPRGVGALDTSGAVGPAAQALSAAIATGGCVTTPFQECMDFQNAFNAAGGNPTLVVDGLYGPATAAAEQQVLTAVDGSTAPAPCVAGHQGGTAPAVVSPGKPTAANGTATTSASGGTKVPVVASASLIPGLPATVTIFNQVIPTNMLLLYLGAAVVAGMVWHASSSPKYSYTSIRTTRAPVRRRRRPVRRRATRRRRRR